MYPNNSTDTFTIYWNDILENLNQNNEDIIDFIKACHSNTLSLISFFLNPLQESAFLDNFNKNFKREWVNQKRSFSACVYCILQDTDRNGLYKTQNILNS